MEEQDPNLREFNPDAEDFFADEIVRKPPGPLSGRPGHHGLFAVAITYLCVVIASAMFWNEPSARALAVSYHTAIIDGKWWQLFTALFVHSGFYHLLANTPMFLVFGYLLRGYFGPVVFPFGCVILGALANYLTVANMPPKQYLVGMSGMNYAMVSLWLTFYMRFETNYPVGVRLMRAMAFSLVVMFPSTYSPNTSYQAHAWGFLLGIALGVLVGQFIEPRSVPAGNGQSKSF